MPKKSFKKQKKDPFEALPDEFKSFVDGAGLEELRLKLSDVAKSDEQNLSAAKADEDLNTKRASVKTAMEPYKEVAKLNKLKRKRLIIALSDKGDVVAENIVKLDVAAELTKM